MRARLLMKLLFPHIALAIGVLTSSIGVRVRRFFGFVLGGAVGQGTVLVVCMGEYTYFLDSFWGAPGSSM